MLIEIKTNKNGWIEVELLSVNKGGTITIKYKGNIIKRKIKNVRWHVTERVVKEQGYTVNSDNKKDKRFKTKKRRRKFKKRKIFKSSKENNQTQDKSKGRRRKIVYIGKIKVNFL